MRNGRGLKTCLLSFWGLPSECCVHSIRFAKMKAHLQYTHIVCALCHVHVLFQSKLYICKYDIRA